MVTEAMISHLIRKASLRCAAPHARHSGATRAPQNMGKSECMPSVILTVTRHPSSRLSLLASRALSMYCRYLLHGAYCGPSLGSRWTVPEASY
jgi:hypothetical protein